MTFADYCNPYAYVMLLRRALYHKGTLASTKLSVPVISIGNLTTGGTGKSPITKLIAEYLRDELHRTPAIVMRGYKRRSKGFVIVSDGRQILADIHESGDEAQSFARELGGVMVICDENRIHGGQEAIRKGADVILLDDGYQHLAVKRDCNILLTNGNEESVLPFGKNREPMSAAQDAHIILQMNSNEHSIPHQTSALMTKAVLRPKHLSLLDGSHTEFDAIRGKKILAISSIAEPKRFSDTLQHLGAIPEALMLPDHAEYSDEVIQKIYSDAAALGSDYIITTTKDIVKSDELYQTSISPCPVAVLHITYEIQNKEVFFQRIAELCRFEPE